MIKNLSKILTIEEYLNYGYPKIDDLQFIQFRRRALTLFSVITDYTPNPKSFDKLSDFQKDSFRNALSEQINFLKDSGVLADASEDSLSDIQNIDSMSLGDFNIKISQHASDKSNQSVKSNYAYGVSDIAYLLLYKAGFINRTVYVKGECL